LKIQEAARADQRERDAQMLEEAHRLRFKGLLPAKGGPLGV
jgi:hypothetical protein